MCPASVLLHARLYAYSISIQQEDPAECTEHGYGNNTAGFMQPLNA